MTERLIIYLGENWPDQTETDWVLLDDADTVLRRGCSGPDEWPAADRLEGIVGAGQCLWLEVPLPPAAGRLKRADEAKLIANGLEDKIIEDPATQHLVVTHRRQGDGGMQAGVLVVAKQRLTRLGEALAAAGRRPHGLYSELQTCPWREGECTLVRHGGDWIVRTAADAALVLPEAMLAASLDTLAPPHSVLHILTRPDDPELPAELLSHIETHGRKMRRGFHPWWGGTRRATNLLQGEFVPARRQRSLDSLRWPLAALALVLVAQLVFTLVIWGKDRLALNSVQGDMARIFAMAAPGQPMVLPAQQLHRIVGAEGARHGQLRDDDALTLLAALGEALGPDATGLLQVDYDNRQLEITLTSEAEGRIGPSLAERFAPRGLRAESKGGGHWRIFVQPIEE